MGSARAPSFWGLHARPGSRARWALGAVPFVLTLAVYLGFSRARLRENPMDKLLPSPQAMAESAGRMAAEPDRRTGERLLWADTRASLRRLGLGVGTGALAGLFVGLNLGLLPGPAALLQPFLTAVSIIPPLAILPILFIAFGVDELSKVALIFIGTFPVIARDVMRAARKTPAEQVVKVLTLGASPLEVIYRIVLPQVLPALVETVRLTLGGAWLYLIAAEAIAAESGLGYRIFLMRRYLAMDVIIPYALWITAIGFALDWGLKTLTRRLYPWYFADEEEGSES
ncbi:MAG: ABC transporter permease subunit [Elusimicrobia bacterium]|nr:ABC transporter permease subunit [Elusimicrobiota bacterium]